MEKTIIIIFRDHRNSKNLCFFKRAKNISSSFVKEEVYKLRKRLGKECTYVSHEEV